MKNGGWVVCWIAVGLCGGCDDSNDGGPDASVVAGTTCGAAPYANVTGKITSFLGNGPVAGAKLTIDLCPETYFVTDANGLIAGQLSINKPYNPRIEATDYITERTGQQILTGDFDASAPVFPASLRTVLVPDWTDKTPRLLILATRSQLNGGADAGGACGTLDGFSFAIKDHPEAKIAYYSNDTLPSPMPGATSTSESGIAVVSGLAATAPGTFVEPTVSKPGCTDVSFTSYPHTGRYILEDDVLTGAAAFVPPIPTP